MWISPFKNLLKYTAEERESHTGKGAEGGKKRGCEIERKIWDNSRLVCRQLLRMETNRSEVDTHIIPSFSMFPACTNTLYMDIYLSSCVSVWGSAHWCIFFGGLSSNAQNVNAWSPFFSLEHQQLHHTPVQNQANKLPGQLRRLQPTLCISEKYSTTTTKWDTPCLYLWEELCMFTRS